MMADALRTKAASILANAALLLASCLAGLLHPGTGLAGAAIAALEL